MQENTTELPSRDSCPKSGELFSTIVGYNDVKKIFALSITSQKPVHILLVGPPASAKTLFMLECMKLRAVLLYSWQSQHKVWYARIFIRKTTQVFDRGRN